MSENKAQQDREAIRQMLAKRYHGAIPVSEEMIDAVISDERLTELLTTGKSVRRTGRPVMTMIADALELKS